MSASDYGERLRKAQEDAGWEQTDDGWARHGEPHLSHAIGDDDYHGDDDPTIELTVVTLAEFAATDEDGADPLLGDSDDILIPANGDVMVYGDGGAGKTTLCLDLACHLAAGDAWLGINVANPLARAARRERRPATAVPRQGRPQAQGLDRRRPRRPGPHRRGAVGHVHVRRASHREALAKAIADHDIDIVIVGPLAAAGMNDAGTLQEVRLFIALCADVRQLAGRNVTFLLIHHENKGGKVSGAWEGAGDTLLHVQGMGSGRTRLHVQKARWSSTWHARTLELRWTDGEGVRRRREAGDVRRRHRRTDRAAPSPSIPAPAGSGSRRRCTGIRSERRRTIRDRLLADGRIVNIVRDDRSKTCARSLP